MSQASTEPLIDSHSVLTAADSTTPATMSKRTLGNSAEDITDEDTHHRQLKKLRMDDGDAAEDDEVVNASQETEKYSWDKDEDWLQDGYFDTVVKSSSQNPESASQEAEEDAAGVMLAQTNGSAEAPKAVPPTGHSENISSANFVSDKETGTDVAAARTTENESREESSDANAEHSANKHVTPTDSAGSNTSNAIRNVTVPKPEGTSSSSARSTAKTAAKCVAVDSCNSNVINCECLSDEEVDEVEVTARVDPGGLFPATRPSEKLLPGKPNIKKLASVMKDAERIGELLNITNLNLLYEKVKQRRGMPNRVEVVMNEIFEKGMDEIEKEVMAQYQGAKGPDVTDELMAEMEDIVKIMKKRDPGCTLDHNDVYALLESNYKKPHRMQAVLNILSGTIGSQEAPMEISDDDDDDGRPKRTFRPTKQPDCDPSAIMEDVQRVLHRFPKVDPNIVYEMLERSSRQPNRVACVLNQLGKAIRSSAPGPNGREVAAGIEQSPVKDDEEQNNEVQDPLVKDTEFVSRMFPDKDKDEIYAYLEAHYNKSNRVDIVTEELLRMNEGGDSRDGSQNTVAPPPPDNMSAVVGEDIGPLAQIEKDVETMRTVFPDCDPMYLYETLSMRLDDPQRVEKLSSELFEHRNYPKLKDRLEKTKRVNLRERLLNLTMDVDEFLQMFPDPIAHFYDVEKPVSVAYKQHAKVHLENCYPMLHSRYIQEKLEDQKGHFTPTLRELEKDAQIYLRDVRQRNMRKSRRYRRRARVMEEQMPDIPDEYFYRELLFARHEQDIKDHLKRKTEEKAERLRVAKEEGQLNECACCYDDEVLFEDMQACSEGHLFCIDCIRRSSEELIGQAKIKFPCLAAGCESEFHTSMLQKVLSSKMFSNLLRKIQENEIQEAGIEDLVACPFCSFATIMPNPDDKVFKCLNPECLKESCRLCSEPSHIPLRCEEVEKKGETDMRTYIENKMTEAMIRICYRCKKRFYKTEGCNKMTCSCGASMCYVCRKPVKGYEHFGGPNGCPQDTDVFELHRQEMEKAAAEARKIYEKDHPDAQGKELKYDPLKEMEDAYKHIRQKHQGPYPPGPVGFGLPGGLFGAVLHRGRGRGYHQHPGHMMPGMFGVPHMNPFVAPPHAPAQNYLFVPQDGDDDDDDEDEEEYDEDVDAYGEDAYGEDPEEDEDEGEFAYY